MDGDGTGLLIIRAWTEPGSSETLRAQVRLSGDISAGFDRTVNLARADEICDLVREWLAGIVAAARGGGAQPV